MKLILIGLALLGLGLTSPVRPAMAAEDDQTVKQFTVNEFTVFPILDRQGSMPAELFSGPLSEEQKLALMPGGQAPSSVNVFLIRGPAGNIRVDAGWGLSGPGEGRLPERLKLAGLDPADIDLIILTHMHPDHIGGLLDGSAPAFPKARLLMSRPELEAQNVRPAQAAPAASGRAKSAAPPAMAANEERSDGAISGRTVSDGLISDDGISGAETTGEEKSNREADPMAPPADSNGAADPMSPPGDAGGADRSAPASGAPADQTGAASPPAGTPVAPADLPGAVLAAYEGRLSTFEFGQEAVPGLTALNAVGHTPGHTAFLMQSGDQKLLFIGDLIHAAALQFPAPDECASYDRDPTRAVTSRRTLLRMSVDQDIPVAGAHIPFPGTGRVTADSADGFIFTPVLDAGR